MREKIGKTSLSAQFSVRAILSRVYIQLDARAIEKGCREIVYSWKNSELESAEQCKGKSIKPHPQPNSIIRAIPSYIYVQLNARPVEESYREVVYS